MTIEPLGELQRYPDIEEWFVSGEIPIPYLGGIELPFIIEAIEGDQAPQEFTNAIQRFLGLLASERDRAAPYVFDTYKRFVDLVGEDEFDFTIESPADVWPHVDLTTVHVSRRPYGDKKVYIQMTGNCDWEEEHGLQIVLREGHELARVSELDGHLTTADAFALPEEQDSIIYKGYKTSHDNPLPAMSRNFTDSYNPKEWRRN